MKKDVARTVTRKSSSARQGKRSSVLPRWRADQWLTLLLAIGILLLTPSFALPSWVMTVQKNDWKPPQPKLLEPVTVPLVQNKTATPGAQVTAHAVYILDSQSGAVLLEKNAHAPVYPASTLKLLTVILSRQLYSLDEYVAAPTASTSGTVVGIRAGDLLSVRTALSAALISSGNDIAEMLAEHHPNGVAGFVLDMRSLAKSLHLDDTTVENPSGLDDPHQQMSARDLAILAKEVMKDDVLRSIVRTQKTTITDLTGRHEYFLKNTNELLGVYPEVVGMKTGTTELAGENLVLQVEKDGHQVIIVILGSQDRYTDARVVLNWLWSNVKWQTFAGVKE